MMKRTSSGVLFNSTLMIIEFTDTDLPEPVVPAISRCGALPRSSTYGMPSMSLPTHIVSREVDLVNASCSAISDELELLLVFALGRLGGSFGLDDDRRAAERGGDGRGERDRGSRRCGGEGQGAGFRRAREIAGDQHRVVDRVERVRRERVEG